MTDKEYYEGLDKLFNEIMKQAGKLCFQDFALLNEVLMETSRRKESSQP